MKIVEMKDLNQDTAEAIECHTELKDNYIHENIKEAAEKNLVAVLEWMEEKKITKITRPKTTVKWQTLGLKPYFEVITVIAGESEK